MVLKNVVASIACASVLALNGLAVADESRADTYKPDQFLRLDLSTAVLSPKLLGPATEFAPYPVEASSGLETLPAAAEPQAAPHAVIPHFKAAQARNVKPYRAARTRLARNKPALSHGNPLDAQASDTRVQVWPCKSGGICNWQR